MNPALFRSFSWFSHFPNLGWFWGALTFDFDPVAWFPARGWSQIARARNIKPIQIFVSIWCSSANCLTPNARSTKFSQTLHRHEKIGNDRKTLGKLTRRKVKAQILRNLRFSVSILQICHFFWDRPTSRPAIPYYSLSLYILGIYALRVINDF